MTKSLVIDDEAPLCLLCGVNLEAEGMAVIEAADGPSGVAKAREEKPDVILLDVMMPGLDGWRVAEQLLEDDRTDGIPIIFLTARAEFRDRARGLDIGGIDYVTKPFNPLELAPLVQALLDRIARGQRARARRRIRGRSTGGGSCPPSGYGRREQGGSRPAVGRARGSLEPSSSSGGGRRPIRKRCGPGLRRRAP